MHGSDQPFGLLAKDLPFLVGRQEMEGRAWYGSRRANRAQRVFLNSLEALSPEMEQEDLERALAIDPRNLDARRRQIAIRHLDREHPGAWFEELCPLVDEADRWLQAGEDEGGGSRALHWGPWVRLQSSLAQATFVAGEREAAIRLGETLLLELPADMDPLPFQAQLMAWATAAGDRARAEEHLAALEAVDPDHVMAAWGRLFMALVFPGGDPEAALARAREVTAWPEDILAGSPDPHRLSLFMGGRPQDVVRGSPVLCVMLDAWEARPEAMAWLREREPERVALDLTVALEGLRKELYEGSPLAPLDWLRSRWDETVRRELLGLAARIVECDMDAGPLIALALLAEMRCAEALPLCLDLLRLPEERVEAILGDAIADGFSRLVASVGAGSEKAIQDVALDPGLYDFCRIAALDALASLTLAGEWPREALIGFLQDLFESRTDDDFSEVWFGMVSVAETFRLRELGSAIRTLYAEGRVLPAQTRLESVETTLAMDPSRPDPVEAQLMGLIQRVEEEADWLFWSEGPYPGDEEDIDDDAEGEPDDLAGRLAAGSARPVRSEKKTGRNDPCPCGSGKKYKKCCLRA